MKEESVSHLLRQYIELTGQTGVAILVMEFPRHRRGPLAQVVRAHP